MEPSPELWGLLTRQMRTRACQGLNQGLMPVCTSCCPPTSVHLIWLHNPTFHSKLSISMIYQWDQRQVVLAKLLLLKPFSSVHRQTSSCFSTPAGDRRKDLQPGPCLLPAQPTQVHWRRPPKALPPVSSLGSSGPRPCRVPSPAVAAAPSLPKGLSI